VQELRVGGSQDTFVQMKAVDRTRRSHIRRYLSHRGWIERIPVTIAQKCTFYVYSI
jgi:hypothetical protein